MSETANLQAEVNAKWDELEEMVSEETVDDPFPLWLAWLEERNIITTIHADCHWGEGGVLEAIFDMIDLLNSDQKVTVVEDPSAEGSDYYSFLVFPR